MVPPWEPVEYLYELHTIAENTVKECCETSEVHPPAPSQNEGQPHGPHDMGMP